ncbi:MAG: hypothetical protein WCK82_14705 [Bacteroidota bacterium]
MNNQTKYKYRLRLGYYSTEYLIEFFYGVENENFGKDLLDAIKEIRPIISKSTDVWMNDEFLYEIKTEVGQFTLLSSAYDFAFIHNKKNQDCVFKIDNLLSIDNRFEKAS